MAATWRVPRDWPGATVAILASGPSMSREVADSVKGRCRVIAVNNQAIDTIDSTTKQLVPAFAPWADVLYAADAKWWHCYQDRALKFAGLKVTLKPNPWPQVHQLQQSPQRVFDPRPTHLTSGGNSGYQALHLAVHFGATRILLCGYDMRDGLGKRRHWFGNHPPKLNGQNAYATWLSAFQRLAPVVAGMGVEVLNCTPKSAIKCFRQSTVEEALRAQSRTTSPPRELSEAGAPAGP
jgi:hypothetical protein